MVKEIMNIFVWIQESAALKNYKNDPLCEDRTALPVQNRSLQATFDSIKGKSDYCCSPCRHNMKPSKILGCRRLLPDVHLWYPAVTESGTERGGKGKAGTRPCPSMSIAALKMWF